MTDLQSSIEAMIATVQANPFDEMNRLILADMIDESGDNQRAEVLRRGNIPLFQEDITAAIELGNCSFAPSTWDKRFARDISARAKGYVQCERCRGQGWITKWGNDRKFHRVDCPECTNGKLNELPDVTPKMFLWLWVLTHRYRRTVKDKAIRKLAAERYERCAELLDIKFRPKRDRRLTNKRHDMRPSLFDGRTA